MKHHLTNKTSTVSLLLIISFLLFSTLGISKEIEVCPSCEVKTIKEAIKIAEKGDVLRIRKGIYKESEINIDKRISMIGEKGAIIDGENKSGILIINTDSVRIEGMTIKHVGRSYTKDYAAINVVKSDYYELINNTLEDVFFGFLIEKSHHGIVRGNHVSSDAVEEFNSGNGIHFWSCNDVLVENNEVYGLRDGIYFEFVKNSSVLNNRSHDNVRYGLHFMFSNHNTYAKNIFINNGAGVAVMFSKFIRMENNIFAKNWGMASYGLLLKEIYDAEIINNTFEENTTGINMEGSTRINYFKNTFKSNGWAIKMEGACYTNILNQNNFIHNAFNLSFSGGLNDNNFEGNYWSDYTGYDLDKNNIGDVPYRPVKLFTYVVNQVPESIVLLRSLFVDIINFSEKVSPVFTPDNLKDNTPLMQEVITDIKR